MCVRFPVRQRPRNARYGGILTWCKWYASPRKMHTRAAGWKWSVFRKCRFDFMPLVLFGWRRWVMSVGEESVTSKLKELISATNVGITQILPPRWHPNQPCAFSCLMCLWCNSIYTFSQSNHRRDCLILSWQLESGLEINGKHHLW